MRVIAWVWVWIAPVIVGCTGTVDEPRAPAGSIAGGAGGAGSNLAGAQPAPAGSPQGAAGPINPGRVVAHRLNKVEYDNTVRDLIGIDLKPSSQFGFPDDNYVEGFDNNAESLSSSPLLLEKYQQAVEAIAARALDPTPGNPARAQIMLCDPKTAGASACATQILTAFATRAFRRPVAAAEITPYLGLLDVASKLGDGFEQAIAAALEAMLLSPKFLFRTEKNLGPGVVAPLDDYEVASRLSYFIWSSMPDAELFQKASQRVLHTPDELRRQVARMIADPKSAAFTENIAGEWLGSRELAVKQITLTDVSFDDALRTAMAQEASAFVHELLTASHPLTDLIGADFIYANQRLATHYGLPNAASLGTELQKLPASGAVRSGGVLTEANFLTVQSQRDRTSPTRRGKWISENMFCVVVPPPPPKIPELVPNDATTPTSTRERLEAHRRKGTTCNGCHQFMDPLGLAFEHYDAVGRWRDTDLGAAIDTTGEIPLTSVAFDGVIQLAGDIKADPRFADCVVQKFFTYALGRGLRLSPQPGDAIDDVAGVADVRMQLLASGNTLARLLELIAGSPLMTMRVGE
jgi:hypothetical protein